MDKTDNTMPRNRRPSAAIGLSRRQHGVIAPLTAVAMLGLLAMVGLALDMGHAYLNRTRLQNSLDAAALSGAKTLDETGDTGLAEAAARAAFTRNADADGNAELQSVGDGDVDISFSPTLDPFNAGGASPRFIRAAVDSFVLPSWLIQVIGIPNKTVGASAVAGPSPVLREVCDIAPVAVCADPAEDPADGGSYWGYTINGPETVLKTGSGTKDWAVGAGNYQNIEVGCGPGGNCIRESMAGAYDGCATVGNTTTTKPGNNVGPNAQGLNTRLGCPPPGCGGLDTSLYKPDVITNTKPDGANQYPDTWDQYQANRLDSSTWDYAPPAGEFERRILKVPIINCTGTTNGAGTVTILGVGCFFITRPVANNGQQEIYGQFLGECEGSGTPGLNPVLGPGPHTIILYKDFTDGNVDS
jgi:hypothetical protein